MFAQVFLAALLLSIPFATPRERAVLVYPKERWSLRPVFYTDHQRKLVREIATYYDVRIHEQVADDDDLFSIDVDGAKLLVLSAHGDPFSMHFASPRERTLDATDRQRLARFLARLDPDATILLQSCHTAKGFAHLVKAAAGPRRRVIAAKGVIPPDGVTITEHAPFDVRIICRDRGRTYDCTARIN
ncbi:MAG TPA: hypothetical protein VGF48_04740 [Thermoanaerobaculia bacterium]|jgi:hypothetical protein